MTGLVGWWQGNGNGNDSASTNNGTVESNVSFVPGLFGEAFSFPGTAPGFVFIPDCNAFELTNSLTIAAWVNLQNGSWVVLNHSDDVIHSYYMTFDSAGHLLFVMNFDAVLGRRFYPLLMWFLLIPGRIWLAHWTGPPAICGFTSTDSWWQKPTPRTGQLPT